MADLPDTSFVHDLNHVAQSGLSPHVAPAGGMDVVELRTLFGLVTGDPEKFGVENNGLALLLAYCLEGAQRAAKAVES